MNAALYERWALMWNGELDIADEIIADGFVAHLTADSLKPPAEVHDAQTVCGWINTVRSRIGEMFYSIEVGPLVDDYKVFAYWQATGTLKGPNDLGVRFAKVGMDILRISGNKIVECWTMNNNAKADLALTSKWIEEKR